LAGAWGKARRGSIAAALCDRGATKPQAVFGATLRAAVLFASRFVARSSQTAEGYARRSRLAGNENSLRRNTSQLRDTTLDLIPAIRHIPAPGVKTPYLFSVAQIFNLPYRRFVIGRTLLAGDIWQVKNLRYSVARRAATNMFQPRMNTDGHG